MGGDDNDGFEDVDEYPVFNRATSRFEWHKPPPATPRWKIYGFEVEGGRGYVLNGIRCKSTLDD